MGKLFSKRKSPKHSFQQGFDSLDGPQTTMTHNVDKYGSYNTADIYAQQQPIHSDAVVSLAKIQPGLCIAGSKDKTITLYDYHNHKLEERWTGHDREVTKVCYGAACRGIFSASRDKAVKLWQRGNSHVIRTFEGHELVVSAIHVNKDNTWLCSGSRDNCVRLWDIESGACLRENKTPRNLVTDVKFVPASHYLLQTGEDKEVSCVFRMVEYMKKKAGGKTLIGSLWDLRTLSIVQEYKGHTEAVESCIFLPQLERALIATSSRDGSVRIWDRDTRECIAECIFSCSGPLTSLIAYDNGSICVSSFNDGIHELHLSLANHTLLQKFKF